ncbi:hypothetical protein ACFFQF_33765 [Haladaptatus pallidirubidus]|uniref:DUF7342 family protein n=1 Tax=Haladaptatus pallidirubidus TaxID=1008152 RepID=UPI0035E89E09
MSNPGHPDDTDAIEKERQRWDQGSSTRDRVYDTAIQLYEPATVDDVASRAHCSEGAAREHLEWLSARGIVEPIDGRPKQYQRNHAYFEWVRANELRREHTDAELETKLSALVAEEQAYREQYGVADPGQIDALRKQTMIRLRRSGKTSVTGKRFVVSFGSLNGHERIETHSAVLESLGSLDGRN